MCSKNAQKLGDTHAVPVKRTAPNHPDGPAKHQVHFVPPFVLGEEVEIKMHIIQ